MHNDSVMQHKRNSLVLTSNNVTRKQGKHSWTMTFSNLPDLGKKWDFDSACK